MRRTFTDIECFSDLLAGASAALKSPRLQQAIDVLQKRGASNAWSHTQSACEGAESRVRSGGSPRNEEILEILRTRNVRGLIHFTPMQNLASILRLGLVPRNELETLQQRGETSFAYTDRHRFDGKDSNCLSICFPNAEMFYCKRCNNPGWSWVVLVVDPQDIACHPAARFSEDNAARGGAELLAGAHGLKQLYGDSPSHHKRPKNPQAEVRVPRKIHPGLIKYICCEKPDDVTAAQSIVDTAPGYPDSAPRPAAVLAKQYFSNPPCPTWRDMPYS